MYHGRCILAYIYIYYGICILRKIYYGRYVKSDILAADILQQICYDRYITAETLWPIYCVQQKRPYLPKFTAPEALDCCVRTCLMQPIVPRTPMDCFIYNKSAKNKKVPPGNTISPTRGHKCSGPRVPGYIYIYMHTYIYIYIHIHTCILYMYTYIYIYTCVHSV